MAAQEHEHSFSRWTHTISLRPVPLLTFYRATLLSLALYILLGWHAAMLGLCLCVLLQRQPSAPAHHAIRLRFGPGDWRWQEHGHTRYYQLHQALRGPFWYSIQLQDAGGRQLRINLWQFAMSKTAWRRLNVLLHAKRWQQLA